MVYIISVQKTMVGYLRSIGKLFIDPDEFDQEQIIPHTSNLSRVLKQLCSHRT